MRDAEEVSDEAAELVALHQQEVLELPAVQPRPLALRTAVDLHMMILVLGEIGAAAWALHEVRGALRLAAHGVEALAQRPAQLEVLAREVFVLVAARLV